MCEGRQALGPAALLHQTEPAASGTLLTFRTVFKQVQDSERIVWDN